MIIDAHTHIAYSKLYETYFLDGIKQNIFKEIKQSTGKDISSKMITKIFNSVLDDEDCEKLINQMNDAGIDKSILLITDMGYQNPSGGMDISEKYVWYANILNKHPDRFIVFAGIDPRRGIKGLELFEKSIKEFNFSGLKLYPPCGFELNDYALLPFYDICNQMHLPVLSHTGPSTSQMYSETEYPESILDVSRQFEDTNFILGHAAFQNSQMHMDLAQSRENIFLEVSGFQRIIHDTDYFQFCLDELLSTIPEQVIFGTDWPMFNLIHTQTKWVEVFKEGFPITSKNADLLFATNVLRVLER